MKLLSFKRSKLLSIKLNKNFDFYQICRQLRHETAVNAKPVVHELKINTCRDLYKNVQSLNKWYLRFGPKSGLEVNVKYVDTKPGDSQCPTLVCLHGSPGGFVDFYKLIHHFGDDYRVIVPNFPDFSLTMNSNHFWHSAEEKAQYIRDILKELNINAIDCLISHSSAIFPTSHLWMKDNELNNNIDIKSLCLLNPPGPQWLTFKNKLTLTLFINISRFKLFRDFLRNIWSERLTSFLGTKNRIADYNTLALLWSTAHLAGTGSVRKRLVNLSELKIPTLFLFSYNDKLFNKEIFYDELNSLKAEINDFEVYEEHGNELVQKSSNNNWIKVLNIRIGGHYCFVTHSKIVHKYIEELLEKVKLK